MSSQIPKLILLPGMDGTGELFADFVKALPNLEIEVMRYPTDRHLSYEQLVPIVRSGISASEPFVFVAESFSTPLAIKLAADNPSNLKGVVICGVRYEPASRLVSLAGYSSIADSVLFQTSRFSGAALACRTECAASVDFFLAGSNLIGKA